MHATFRRDHPVDPLRRDEAAQRPGEGLLPALSQTAGCVATCMVAADGSVICLALRAGAGDGRPGLGRLPRHAGPAP